MKFGFDPIIGLIPVVGDILTSVVSFGVVFEAYRTGCGISVLLRMLFNIFLEDAIKVIPVFGQMFDFYWKSNIRNVLLLENYLEKPKQTQRHSFLLLCFLVFACLISLCVSIGFSIYIFKLIWIQFR